MELLYSKNFRSQTPAHENLSQQTPKVLPKISPILLWKHQLEEGI